MKPPKVRQENASVRSDTEQRKPIHLTHLLLATGRERASDRKLAAERLGQGLVRWSRNRKSSAFYRLVSGVEMITAESDVRERTRRALREAGESARRSQEAAVEVSGAALDVGNRGRI